MSKTLSFKHERIRVLSSSELDEIDGGICADPLPTGPAHGTNAGRRQPLPTGPALGTTAGRHRLPTGPVHGTFAGRERRLPTGPVFGTTAGRD
jgi:hypothetical protein